MLLPRLGRLAVMTTALLTAACGGGGGGGGSGAAAPVPPPPEPTPPPTLFAVSGAAIAPSSQAVDGDSNDPDHPAVPNDTVGTAQPIPAPITLGGYVNRPGTGAPGRSQEAGDTEDFFRAELLAGQSVTLLVADFEQADADLYLYTAAGEIERFSIETGEIERLVIPRDGTWIINVFAYAGATNYILAVGEQNTSGTTATAQREFVPWQAVVKYREGGESQPGSPATPTDWRHRLGLEQRGGGPGRARLMGLRRQEQASARLGSALAKREAFGDPALRASWETLSAIKTLGAQPEVEYVEPNFRVHALAVPNDQAYPIQWHYPLINLPPAWDYTVGDPGVVIAVVDTGVLSRHPDLRGQWIPGYDFVSDPASAADGDGIDPDPEDPGGADTTVGGGFHGTHVSGTVGAAGNNRVGVVGVAWGSRVMPLRALGADGTGTSYDVAQAVRYAAGLGNDSGELPARAADIINLSLGGEAFTRSGQELYRQVREKGVVVVAAAGNENSTVPGYPASYDGVISVSAVDAQRRVTRYSNSGSAIDIAAPGGDMSVDLNGDGYPDGVLSTGGSVEGGTIRYVYPYASGTSFAAPHVAGVIALMKSVNPQLTPADIDAMLARGELTDDLGRPGRDDAYGHGLVNAGRAVLAALAASGSAPADNPLLVASAGSLNFGAATTAIDLQLANGGGGDLELLQIASDTAWLRVAPVAVDDRGLGEYRVTVDRSDLAPGVYAGALTAESSVNTVVVRVVATVGSAGVVSDVGRVYFLLYDLDTDEPVAEVAADPRNGRYPFSFEGIPAGRYRIIAGTDADNDLFICDRGEACGAWLTLDQPLAFDLDRDLENVEFPVEFQVSIPASPGVTAIPPLPPASRPPAGIPRRGDR